jgi:hypothetical protein
LHGVVVSSFPGDMFAWLLLVSHTFTAFLMQNANTARSSLLLLDPALNQSLPERIYGEDCRIYTPEHPDSSFANIKVLPLIRALGLIFLIMMSRISSGIYSFFHTPLAGYVGSSYSEIGACPG